MREIKFRGKSIVEPEWVYGYYYKTGRYGIICHDKNTLGTTVDIETIGQYAELKDTNKKEIYEGDIVKAYVYNYERTGGNSDDIEIKGVITYEDCSWFIEEKKDEGCELFETYINDDELEIIGNIYDNPELLERAN